MVDVEKQPFLSIIVPVYNAQEYLKKCVNSIQIQSWNDLEILLIDDGSTDQSPTICDRLALEDERIRVFHTPNAGCVHARKVGVRNSRGKYIGFVDSDDWLNPEMYNKLCSKIIETNADLAICDIIRYENDSNICEWTQFFKSGVYDKEKLKKIVYPQMLYTGNYYEFGFLPCVWNKVVRKEIVEQCLYKIDDNITMGEDLCWTLFALWNANKMVYLKNEYLYYYRDTSGSMVKQGYINQLERIIALITFLDKEIKANDIDNILTTQFYYYTIAMVSNTIIELYSKYCIKFQLQKTVIKKIRQMQNISDVINKKNELILPELEKCSLELVANPTIISKVIFIVKIIKNKLRKCS